MKGIDMIVRSIVQDFQKRIAARSAVRPSWFVVSVDRVVFLPGESNSNTKTVRILL
jgi:hypothetical protein